MIDIPKDMWIVWVTGAHLGWSPCGQHETEESAKEEAHSLSKDIHYYDGIKIIHFLRIEIKTVKGRP